MTHPFASDGPGAGLGAAMRRSLAEALAPSRPSADELWERLRSFTRVVEGQLQRAADSLGA